MGCRCLRKSRLAPFPPDLLDRPDQVARPSGFGSSTFTYNDTALTVSAATDRNSSGDSVSTSTYDLLGRVILKCASTPTGSLCTSTQYDALGRVSAASNPYINGTTPEFTRTVYDALSRPTTVTYPDGSSQSLSYTGASVTITDPFGVQRTQTSDALGRLLQATENPGGPRNAITAYSYDVLDDLLTVTQGSQTRTFTYNTVKQLLSAVNPETGTISYAYDLNSNVKTKTHGSLTVNYTYDPLNRILTRSYNDGNTPQVNWQYDTVQKGCLTFVDNGVSKTMFAYDAQCRVHQSTQYDGATPYTFTYGYNSASDLTDETYPSGRTVHTGYDKAGRPNLLTGYLSNFDYVTDPHGMLAGVDVGNGVRETAQYNNRMQMTQRMAATKSSGLILLKLQLGFVSGNNGNVASQTISHDAIPAAGEAALSLVQSYCYDQINRISGFNEGASASSNCSGGVIVQGYDHDQWGNRWVASNVNSGFTLSGLTPTSSSWYVTSTNRLNLGAGAFDARGNQLAVSPSTLTYDGDNLVKTANNSQTITTYTYDGNGRRVKKTGSATTLYVYDAFGHLAQEYGTATGTNSTDYLTTDHLGSTRLITDGSGGIKKRYDYLPFGEGLGSTVDGRSAKYSVGDTPATADGETVKFTTKERDAETGLDFFGARYMSSAQGRFTSPDRYNPMLIKQNLEAGGLPGSMAASVLNGFLENPQNWNQYAYVRNNPLRFTDPTGAAPAEGHHLIINRNLLTNPIAQDFANKIKTGPLSGVDQYPNQWSNATGHPAYNEAVEEIMTDVERVEGDRNSWGVGQWQRVARQILSSKDFRIKDFLDELEANNPNARVALATAISTYRASASTIAEYLAYVWAGRIEGFLIMMVPPAATDPQKHMQEEEKKSHQNCLLDRDTGNCIQ